MNYEDIIAQALSGINPAAMAKPPALNTGTPLVPQQNLQQAISSAMTPGGVALPDEDRTTALAKIGISLMQPRMPGQTVAGNLGNAANAGIDYADAAKQRAQKLAMEQAQLGSNVATQDTQRRTLEATLQQMAVKFPMEVAEIQQRLRKAALEGKTAEYNMVATAITQNPGAVVERVRQDLQKGIDEQTQRGLTAEKTAAETGKITAEAARVPAQAREDEARAKYLEAYSKYLDAQAGGVAKKGTRQTLNVRDLDDGRVIQTFGLDGKVYTQITDPGLKDMASAMKVAEKQLKAEKGSGWFAAGPTPQEIQARAKELMTAKTIYIDSSNRVVPNPETAAPTSATPAPANTDPGKTVPPVPRDKTGSQQQQLELLRVELAKNPPDAEDIKKEISVLEGQLKGKKGATPATSTPGAVKAEVWTPERIHAALNPAVAATTQTDTDTPSTNFAPMHTAEYDAARKSIKVGTVSGEGNFMSKHQEGRGNVGAEQVMELREKMESNTPLTPTEKAQVRRLSVKNPKMFTKEELVKAGVPLPPGMK